MRLPSGIASCVLPIALSAVFAASHCWGLEGLRFYEISPVEPDGPWLEVVNYSSAPVLTTGLVLASGPDPLVFYQAPTPSPPLAGKAMAVIVFDAPSGMTPVSAGAHRWLRVIPSADPTDPWSHGDPPFGFPPAGPPPEVHLPAEISSPWAAGTGWVALLDGPPAPGAAFPNILDLVAWGPDPDTSALGHPRGVPSGLTWVSLSEGFGALDQRAHLEPGQSIGVAPLPVGSARRAWTRYDSVETSKASRPNALPRPKAITLPSGSRVGPNSVALAWPSDGVEDGFVVTLDRLGEDGTVELRREGQVSRPAVRWFGLTPGRYEFHVTAIQEGRSSLPSRVVDLQVLGTPCDPVITRSLSQLATLDLQDWLIFPDCPPQITAASPECHIVESVEFRFQRKDTPMLCHHPDCGPGRWDRPQPFCQDIMHVGGCVSSTSASGAAVPGATTTWCGSLVRCSSDGRVSRSCRAGVPWAAPSSTPSVANTTEHGFQYCVPASVSMMTSTFGACLSQDRIAFFVRDPTSSTLSSDLMHGVVVAPDSASLALEWALGIPKAGVNETSAATGLPSPTEEEGYSLLVRNGGAASATTFAHIESWISSGRPVMVMTSTPAHAVVVVGTCDDDIDEMLFVHDPRVGPMVRSFSSLSASGIAGVWVGPSVSQQLVCGSTSVEMGRIRSTFARGDDMGIWSDHDGDFVSDFDEARRFGTSPFCFSTTAAGGWDKQVIQSLSSTTAWTPFEPRRECPTP